MPAPKRSRNAASLAPTSGYTSALRPLDPFHSRRCTVCHHPDRPWIELRFIEWGSPALIAREFGIRDRGTIYRHAHAAGLFAVRLRNLMCLYENILERAEETNMSSHGVMPAATRLERAMSAKHRNAPVEIRKTVNRIPSRALDPASDQEITIPPFFKHCVESAETESQHGRDTHLEVIDINKQKLIESLRNFGEHQGEDQQRATAFVARLRQAIYGAISEEEAYIQRSPD
jgi:hypothetical protein